MDIKTVGELIAELQKHDASLPVECLVYRTYDNDGCTYDDHQVQTIHRVSSGSTTTPWPADDPRRKDKRRTMFNETVQDTHVVIWTKTW